MGFGHFELGGGFIALGLGIEEVEFRDGLLFEEFILTGEGGLGEFEAGLGTCDFAFGCVDGCLKGFGSIWNRVWPSFTSWPASKLADWR